MKRVFLMLLVAGVTMAQEITTHNYDEPKGAPSHHGAKPVDHGIGTPMPFSLQNPESQQFAGKMATDLYWGAAREVGKELNKKELVPVVILRFYAKAEKPSTVTFRNGTTLIVLKEWNPGAFAQAAVWAANYSALLDQDAVITITNRVIREYNATVSATDLKKAK